MWTGGLPTKAGYLTHLGSFAPPCQQALNISLKIQSTNESHLFSGSRHSSVKRKIKLTLRC